MMFFQGLSVITKIIPSGGSLTNMFSAFIWLLLVLGGVGLVIYLIRQASTYKYRGEIILRRQEDWETALPTGKTLSGKAGYVNVKGRLVFRIRYGMLPHQVIDILKLPNPKYMAGNTAYFLQYNIGEIVQAKKIINWNTSTINVEPIDNTTKDSAKQELSMYSQILSTTRISPQLVAIATMGFILVTGIIVLYFISKAG